MQKAMYYALACALLAAPMGCTTTAPGPATHVASAPAYLPARLPRPPKQHVLDSLARAAAQRRRLTAAQ